MLKNNNGSCISKLHEGYILVNYKKMVKCCCGVNNYQINVWIKNKNDSKLIAKCCYECAIKKIENKQMKLF